MVELKPHQQEALGKLSNGKILTGGVGTGKSRVAAAYHYEKERGRDVYVVTTAKKRDSLDWEREFAGFGVSGERLVEGVGQLKVDSWNNLRNYTGVFDAFFIFDEQRLVGKGAWVKAFLKIAKKNHWILLSATPGDTWLDYIPVFIANGFYRNRTDFTSQHVVYNTFTKFPKVDRYVSVGKLVRLRRSLLVKMPYERLTTRHIHEVRTGYDIDLYERASKDRWNVFEDRPIRDVSEYYSVLRRIVNTSPARVKACADVIEKHPKLIIFYNFDYELEILRKTAGNFVESHETKVAEWNGHKHEPIPETDRWVYLVQYLAGAEGWNCTETDTILFYSLNYSYRLFEQGQGRIDRMDTLFIDLHYYVLKSLSWIDNNIWKANREKRNFNEDKTVMGGQISCKS